MELKSVIKSLGGHHRVLQVIIGRTMFVHIILRGLNIDRVFARGIDEEDNLDGEDQISTRVAYPLVAKIEWFSGFSGGV